MMVVSHPFYPLLTYQLLTPRIRKLPRGSGRPFVKEPKTRSIAYPAHKDGYIFSYYKSILECPYEHWLRGKSLGETVTAFRSTGENNVTLAQKAFEFIGRNRNCQIVVTDVESFFDSLNHELLRKTWARFLGVAQLPDDHYAVYKAITRYSVVERHKAYNLFGIRLSGYLQRTRSPRKLCTPKQFRDKVVGRGLIRRGPKKGIPQGTSLSPLLSNMYMADLDLALHNWTDSHGGRYWRYCDDILIVMPGKSRPGTLQALDYQLKLLDLTRNKEKTHTIDGMELSSHKQLQYLGFVFNGSDAVIRPSSIHRYRRKVKKSIWMAKRRRDRESKDKTQPAPLRKQALYNMYSDKPVRGKRIQARIQRNKFRGNFIKYMAQAANTMNSSRISRQRKKALEEFRNSIQE